jgi:hypothetical protein
MELKLKIDNDRDSWSNEYQFVVVEIRGEPELVESLKNLITDFVKKQENPPLKYY